MMLFSATPNPCPAGSELAVCYTFQPGQSKVVVSFTFDTPKGQEGFSVILKPERPCVTILVPSDAEGLLIEDTSGVSDDLAVTIT